MITFVQNEPHLDRLKKLHAAAVELHHYAISEVHSKHYFKNVSALEDVSSLAWVARNVLAAAITVEEATDTATEAHDQEPDDAA